MQGPLQVGSLQIGTDLGIAFMGCRAYVMESLPRAEGTKLGTPVPAFSVDAIMERMSWSHIDYMKVCYVL